MLNVPCILGLKHQVKGLIILLKSIQKPYCVCVLTYLELLEKNHTVFLNIYVTSCRKKLTGVVVQFATQHHQNTTQIQTRGPRTLALCLTPAVGMTNGNFLQTCIKSSLLYTKQLKFGANSLSHSTLACFYQLDHFQHL